ncbi:myb/SANT-like DNA-binding domain-containing protein 4 [Clytia hemisphaerica]|uniref:myb/SANT-like DNA-binding domain-containing protein 4 n=1 Tax=Clytia hemisphaerica TaxID=252671 RepID=UPI0034D4E145
MENVNEKKPKFTRKPNFSADETRVLLDSHEEFKDILEGKFSNALTQQNKNESWQKIASNVNAVGVTPRTIASIQNKFKNIKSEAKLAYNKFKGHQNGTGGGPPPKEPSSSDQRIMSLFEGRPSFEGLHGFATNAHETEIGSYSTSMMSEVSADPMLSSTALMGPQDETNETIQKTTKGKQKATAPKQGKSLIKRSTLTANKKIQKKCLLQELAIQKTRLKGERLRNKNLLLKERNLRRADEILTLQKEKLQLEISLMKGNILYAHKNKQNVRKT